LIDEPQDQASEQDPTDEGSEAPPAGPVAGEDSSSSQAAGEEPTPTPPADEAAESADETPAAEAEPAAEQPVDEAPAADVDSAEEPAAEESVDEAPAADAEEEKVDEAPAADAEAAEEAAPEAEAAPEPEAEKPAAEEKKKDVIPGADLEPIAVETPERPLSAEERARKEAEEEERAKREAALTGEGDEEPSAASRAPAKMAGDARYLATGKRKTSIARVTLLPGSGKIEINKRALEEFFPRPLHQTTAVQPLTITGYEGSVDVRVRVHGGGISGQAGAVRHGIARALTEVDPELRGELKRRGFLTRDARAKERKKAGLKKARKRPQFSKR
jgi:small subunit ribosomal protein S9